jgi:hypothetical protein
LPLLSLIAYRAARSITQKQKQVPSLVFAHQASAKPGFCFYGGCTDTLIGTSAHQPYLLDTSQPRSMIHLLLTLEGLLAFSFPFADATGELMTHEVCTFQDALGKCVTGPPSRASASQSSTASQKQTTSFVFRASAADMDLAPVVN